MVCPNQTILALFLQKCTTIFCIVVVNYKKNIVECIFLKIFTPINQGFCKGVSPHFAISSSFPVKIYHLQCIIEVKHLRIFFKAFLEFLCLLIMMLIKGLSLEQAICICFVMLLLDKTSQFSSFCLFVFFSCVKFRSCLPF